MRFLFFIFLIQLTFFGHGQKIEFKHDSLFINSLYVNGFTSKSTLDSLLNSKSKEEKKKGKHFSDSSEIMNLTIYKYKKDGLIFSKNDNDISKLSIALKLYKNSDPFVDQNNMPTNTFKGTLYIDDNFMNDKRHINQLQKLKNCTVTFKESSFNSQTGIIGCNIKYLNRPISVLFDFKTNEMTCIFIN